MPKLTPKPMLLLAICTFWASDLTVSLSPATAQDRSSRGDRDAEEDDDDGDERRSWGRGRRGDRARREGRDRDGRRGSRRDRGNDAVDDQAEEDRSARSSSTSRATSTSTASEGGMDTRSYARSLIAKHDKDGNKMLSGEELAGLSGAPARADLNNDGTITSDELVAKLSGHASAIRSANESSSVRSGEDSNPGEVEKPAGSSASRDRRESTRGASNVPSMRTLTNGDRKFYRFKMGKDRLPSGLPSYFSRDANSDGQISMHEYASAWNDRTAATFREFDLNGDGMITVKEALKSK